MVDMPVGFSGHVRARTRSYGRKESPGADELAGMADRVSSHWSNDRASGRTVRNPGKLKSSR
jgi:hypothetical protein